MIASSPTTPAATPAGTGAATAAAAVAATLPHASPKPASSTAAAVSSVAPDRTTTCSGSSDCVRRRASNAYSPVAVEEEKEVDEEKKENEEEEEGGGGGRRGGAEEEEEEEGGHHHRLAAHHKPTVDAATQYSRPATPSNPLVTATTGSTAESQLSTALSSMPVTTTTAVTTTAATTATAVRGSKRNTPDEGATAAPAKHSSSLTSYPADLRSSGGIGDSGADGDDRHVTTESPSKRLRPAQPSPKVLAPRYEEVDIHDLVVLISSMLMELIRFNDQIPLRDGRLTRFHSRSPPRISVQDYLQRLATHASLSRPILLSMVYYIDRLCALYPAFTISSLTVHRFLISSATVASKGLSDSFLTNQTYARVGGISVAELALLELEFLWRVEWRIVPQPEVLADYYRSLVERCDDYVIGPDIDPPEDKPASMNGVNDDPDKC